MITIEARDRDAEVAKLMATTLAQEFVDERTAYYAQQDKANRIEVKIVSLAIGAEKYQPKPLFNAIAGGVLGLLLGIAVVLVLLWMEAELMLTPDSVERALNLPVLGAIPTAAGKRSQNRNRQVHSMNLYCSDHRMTQNHTERIRIHFTSVPPQLRRYPFTTNITT